MPPTATGFLLDFLAPRLFRTVPKSSTFPVGRGVRSGSSAAVAEPRTEDDEGQGVTKNERGRREREGSENLPVAGPSRWHGQLRDEPPHMSRSAGREAGSQSFEDVLGSSRQSSDMIRGSRLSDDLLENTTSRTPTLPSTLQSAYTNPTSEPTKTPLYTRQPKLTRHDHRVHMARARDASRRNPIPFKPIFAQPNPPAASVLFPLLQDNLTKSSGDLLVRYAQRVDDRRTETATRDLMGRMRLAPMSWIMKSDPIMRRRAPFIDRDLEGETVEGEQSFGSGDDPPGNPAGDETLETTSPLVSPRKPLSPEMRELRAKSNTWARRMWPPPLTPTYAPANKLTPHTFLCHQHRQLLYPPRGIRPTFVDALRRLENTPGVRDRDLLSLLHLHLAYPIYTPTPSPSPSLDSSSSPQPRASSALLTPLHQLLSHCPRLRPTHQTLHLLILSTLFTPSTRRSTLASTTSFSAGTEKRAEISTLLTLFRTSWRISPGCEGWRHITRYAVHVDMASWAREGWDAWWKVERRTKSLHLGEGVVKALPEGKSGPEKGDEVEYGGADEEEYGDVVFRFRHRGREMMRWERVVRSMEEKGWLKPRGSIGSDRLESKDGWDWVGGH